MLPLIKVTIEQLPASPRQLARDPRHDPSPYRVLKVTVNVDFYALKLTIET
jgi:hypothetical protein